MYYLVKEYINKINEDDIEKYALKEGIKLLDNEKVVIYNFIKENWEDFFTNESDNLLKKIENDVRPEIYNYILKLYNKYKRQFNK